MLRYRTASGLVTSTARGRYRDASGQSVAFGSAAPGGETFHFFTDSDVTSAASSFDDASVTLGTRLRPTSDLYTVGMRFLAPVSAPTIPLQALLYSDVGAPVLVKNVPFTLPQLSEKHLTTGEWITLYWHEVFWDAPVLIPAGETWTWGVVTNKYVARAGFHDAPITRGLVAASFGAGYFQDTLPSPVFPDKRSGSPAYFIDALFTLP